MTISTTSSVATFLGNGVTPTFTFSFVGVAASDITVIYTTPGGVSTVLTPSQYTLFLNAPNPGQLWGVGGTVTYPTVGSPIPNGSLLQILRNLPLTQQASITNQGNMWPTVIEQALDTLCMEIQQVSARSGRILGVWTTATSYSYGDIVQDGVNGADTQNYYLCVQANTSGTWSTDLADGLWALAINVQQIAAYAAAAEASAVSAATSASAAAGSASSASTDAATASAAATTATTQAGIATTEAGIATAAAAAAQSYSISYSGTSSTSVLIGTGSKTFTTQPGKLWTVGQYLIIPSNANPANYFHGYVASYSGTTLTLNAVDVGGSGTFADWNINISGTQGPAGGGGGTGTVTSVSFTGDGVTTANTASTPVTTAGTVTATTASQNANTIIAGPVSGSPGPLTARALVSADIGAGVVGLTSLAAQAADTILANATSGSASPTAVAVGASQLVGRGSSGDIAPITLGSNLTMAGTTLNASTNGADALVLFDQTTTANLTGTYSRTGTTVTVSVTGHGMVTGNTVQLTVTSGALTTGSYVLTGYTANTFTVTSGTSGTTSGNVTLPRVLINGSKNVNSVVYNTTGIYFVNFTNPLSSANYVIAQSTIVSPSFYGFVGAITRAATACTIETRDSTGVATDHYPAVDLAFFST